MEPKTIQTPIGEIPDYGKAPTLAELRKARALYGSKPGVKRKQSAKERRALLDQEQAFFDKYFAPYLKQKGRL